MDIQIQNIKFQMKNIELQFDNIIMLMQNMGIGVSNFENQIKNIGIQIINIGIQMINIVLPKPNKGIDDPLLKTEIQNSISQLQNIVMKLNNNNNIFESINNNNLGNPIRNNLLIKNENNFGNEINSNTIKVRFQTKERNTKILTLDSETIVGDMLKLYLKEMNRLDVINSQKKILFLFNSHSLSFEDKTKIGTFFKGIINPYIFVYEDNSMIG